MTDWSSLCTRRSRRSRTFRPNSQRPPSKGSGWPSWSSSSRSSSSTLASECLGSSWSLTTCSSNFTVIATASRSWGRFCGRPTRPSRSQTWSSRTRRSSSTPLPTTSTRISFRRRSCQMTSSSRSRGTTSWASSWSLWIWRHINCSFNYYNRNNTNHFWKGTSRAISALSTKAITIWTRFGNNCKSGPSISRAWCFFSTFRLCTTSPDW